MATAEPRTPPQGEPASPGEERPGAARTLAREVGRRLAAVPLLGWLVAALASVALEQAVGGRLASALGLPKIPVLFFLSVLKEPLLAPQTLAYFALVYVLPIGLVARLATPAADAAATVLLRFPLVVTALVHLGLLYASLHYWTDLSDYRLLTVKLTLIGIILTFSLNVINGYMGEFSCSHPGFMALGAYGASLVSVPLFGKSILFAGAPLLPAALGPYCFPLALAAGGMLAAAGALLVAVPSFRTRGDYLAIISLAFMFIVKSVVENAEVVGGPRGLAGQPDWATLPAVFSVAVLCIWIINNFVTSTLGKALNAVRDNEIAAEAMTVDTRRTKTIAFLFGAFWAGVAGGLFAHVLRYINPAMFGVQQLAEVLAMVYFGGLNSVYGSIVGAVSINLLSEMLRPLEMFKWIAIPLLLILVMIFRPLGLVAFKDFDLRALFGPGRRGS
jgi:branched-chain amino acid transport system permease protein